MLACKLLQLVGTIDQLTVDRKNHATNFDPLLVHRSVYITDVKSLND